MYQPLGHVFGQRVKNLREERGLSQNRVAASAGISASALGTYELGKRRKAPNSEVVYDIAEFLGVSADYLLGRVEDRYSHTSSNSQRLLNTLDTVLGAVNDLKRATEHLITNVTGALEETARSLRNPVDEENRQ